MTDNKREFIKTKAKVEARSQIDVASNTAELMRKSNEEQGIKMTEQEMRIERARQLEILQGLPIQEERD